MLYLSIKTTVMQSIFEPATLQDILQRIDKLTPDSQAKWGKMNVAQMLTHVSVPVEVALGDKTINPPFIMKLFAPLMKPTIVNEKPYKQGLPTAKEFEVTDARDFNKEKTRLVSLVTRLSHTPQDEMNNRRHPFFGKFTAAEWSNANVKHLDHHLKQFGA